MTELISFLGCILVTVEVSISELSLYVTIAQLIISIIQLMIMLDKGGQLMVKMYLVGNGACGASGHLYLY